MCRYGRVLNKANLNTEINCLCKKVIFRIYNHYYTFYDLEVNFDYKEVWLYRGRIDATKNKHHNSTKIKLIRCKLRIHKRKN